MPLYTPPSVKATGAELDTLTDDAKFLTAKAVQDGKNVPHAVPSTAGKVLRSNGTDWASSNILWSDLPTGSVVQTVVFNSVAVATGTTQMVLDDTIPQITEGNEYMTLAITPKSATDTLVIALTVMWTTAISTATNMIGAIFQDATAGALAASTVATTGNSFSMQFNLTHTMVAGTTSATTFRLRMGCTAAGTTTFNGRAGGRLFGAINKASMTITEIKV